MTEHSDTSDRARAGSGSSAEPTFPAWLSVVLLALGWLFLAIQALLSLAFLRVLSLDGWLAVPPTTVAFSLPAWMAARFAQAGPYPRAAQHLGRAALAVLAASIAIRVLH